MDEGLPTMRVVSRSLNKGLSLFEGGAAIGDRLIVDPHLPISRHAAKKWSVIRILPGLTQRKRGEAVSLSCNLVALGLSHEDEING